METGVKSKIEWLELQYWTHYVTINKRVEVICDDGVWYVFLLLRGFLHSEIPTAELGKLGFSVFKSKRFENQYRAEPKNKRAAFALANKAIRVIK